MFPIVYQLSPYYGEFAEMLKLMQCCNNMSPREFGMKKKWNKPRKR